MSSLTQERLEFLAREIKTDWAHRCRPASSRRRPPIVTLCGSTRFKDEFLLANRVFTLAGIMVLTVGTFPHAEGDGDKEVSMGEAVAADLDALHVQKVVHGDYVVILNVGHYLGNSAYLEYKAAKREGKKILWLEELPLSVREIVNDWAKAQRPRDVDNEGKGQDTLKEYPTVQDYSERGMKENRLPSYEPHLIGFDDQGRPSVVLNLYLP